MELLPWQKRLMTIPKGHKAIVMKPRQHPIRELQRLFEAVATLEVK